MADEICANCGHSKFDHAISLKGVVGACLKETIKNWEYCACKQFCPTKRAADSLKAGWKSAKRKVVKAKVIRPAKSG